MLKRSRFSTFEQLLTCFSRSRLWKLFKVLSGMTFADSKFTFFHESLLVREREGKRDYKGREV